MPKPLVLSLAYLILCHTPVIAQKENKITSGQSLINKSPTWKTQIAPSWKRDVFIENTMQWLNANPHPAILGEDKVSSTYYADDPRGPDGLKLSLSAAFKGKKKGFVFSGKYDRHRGIVIDPFVTSTGAALVNANAGKVMQINNHQRKTILVPGWS